LPAGRGRPRASASRRRSGQAHRARRRFGGGACPDALRSDDPELRYAAITGLGRIAADEGWAVDLLIEALAEGRERAARIAAALDRGSARPGHGWLPLLGHPSAVVRFWSIRLLARYPERRREVGRLSDDPNAQVRAAVLETLRTTASAR